MDANSFFAVSVSIPLFTLIYALGHSLGQGANSIMSISISSNNYENAYNSIIHGILLFILTWIITIIAIVLIDDVLILLGLTTHIDLIIIYLTPMFLFSIFLIFPH